MVELLMDLAGQFPLLAVWGVALLLALVRWRQHSQVSLLTVIATAGMMVLILGSPFLSHLLIKLEEQYGYSLDQVDLLHRGFYLIRNILFAALFGLFLWAIFSGRTGQSQR